MASNQPSTPSAVIWLCDALTRAQRVSREQRQEHSQSGDTLSAICLKFYGNANKYPQVAEANGIDANHVPAGKTIHLPVLSWTGPLQWQVPREERLSLSVLV